MSNESTPGGDTPRDQPAENASRIDDPAIVEDPSVLDHPRYQQMFPVLTEAEIDRLRRFGSVTRHAKGELLYQAGKISPACSSCYRARSGLMAGTAWAMCGPFTPTGNAESSPPTSLSSRRSRRLSTRMWSKTSKPC